MDVIPPPIQAALELFESSLAEVRFADIDVKTLAQAAADVKDVALAVASAQAALDTARSVLEERQEALLQKVHRAVAYARVYAESNEALRKKLEAIRLPRPARPARGPDVVDAVDVTPSEPPASAPRPRGRPRKAPVADPTRADAGLNGSPSIAENGRGDSSVAAG